MTDIKNVIALLTAARGVPGPLRPLNFPAVNAFRAIAFLVMLTCAVTWAAPSAHGDDVDITLLQVGVGGAFRPGDPTGMLVRLTSRLPEPTAVFAQWEVLNPDGDTAEYGRTIALTPNFPMNVWLYAPLLPSPHVDSQTVWAIRLFEETEDGRIGRELAVKRVSPGDVSHLLVNPRHGMIGVIGDSRTFGLSGYDIIGAIDMPHPPGGMEYTRIIAGIEPEDMPDRWEGLRSFEALVWGTGQRASPQDLRLDPARALREYVRRGGHLIICLPEAGEQWGLGRPGATELSDLLPSRAPRVDPDVMVSEVAPLLHKSRTLSDDFPIAVRVFAEADGSFNALDNGWEPLMGLPDGRIVVAQRIYGTGRITLIGIDVTSTRLRAALQRPPHADVFWNNILSRRLDTPTPTELAALDQDQQLIRQRAPVRELGLPRIVGEQINMRRHAGIAVIMSLFLFAVYWLIAGPVAYFGLRSFRLQHWSWVAFAAASVVFTFIAFGAVNVIRDRDVSVRHLTVLDLIARPPHNQRLDEPQLQRARSWFSIYTPRYGRTSFEIESLDEQRDLLYVWQQPGEGLNRFPNPDRYRVDVRRQTSSLTVPSRSTMAQVHADWMGVVPDEWLGAITLADPNRPITMQRGRTGVSYTLSGEIQHSLPGTLTDVRIILISGHSPHRLSPPRYLLQEGGIEGPSVHRDLSGRVVNTGFTIRPPGAVLEPGEVYDLEEITRAWATGDIRNRLDRQISDEYMRALAADRPLNLLAGRDRLSVLEMLSMYHLLTPPSYIGEQRPQDDVVAERIMGRELDLSPWMNRPCLIIIGYLDNSTLPLPLKVDGREVASEGLTMVRWIYPLPVAPEDTVYGVPDDPSL